MGGPKNKGYKRSWRNLLINKRYQLRFTLFMVALSAVMMSLLGWWVMTVAAGATTVAVNNTLSSCQDLPGAKPSETSAARAIQPAPQPSPPVAPAEPRSRPRPVVTIDDSGMEDLPAPEADAGMAATAEEVAVYERCVAGLSGKVAVLARRQQMIFWVLIGVGVLLALGLLVYGILMTHKVAGPLHKVTLYLDKLRNGRYDPVYNLRKGDHLVGFYEHFKAAHAGMRTLQDEDLVRLRALLAAADQAQLAGRSPEMAAALAELRALAEHKEKSLV
jgi:hypothetical protein